MLRLYLASLKILLTRWASFMVRADCFIRAAAPHLDFVGDLISNPSGQLVRLQRFYWRRNSIAGPIYMVVRRAR